MPHTDPRRQLDTKTCLILLRVLRTQRLLINRRGGIDRAVRPDRGKGSSSRCERSSGGGIGNRRAEAIKGRCSRAVDIGTERRWIRGDPYRYPPIRQYHGGRGKSKIVLGKRSGL